MNSDFSFEIRIVYDDICAQPGFLKGFGFSALIYNNLSKRYLLFDTGSKGNVLIHNINKFNVNVSEIRKIIISHSHYDHAGGLKEIYNLNRDIEIYVPYKDMKSFMGAYPEAYIQGTSELCKIDENIYSSGQFGISSLKEQALFLKTENMDIIILSGCAHPGLETFILKSKTLSKKIKAVIGGFHGFKDLMFLEGIDFIGACHCTQRIKEIRLRFPEQFNQICVGDNFLF
jgi:7,8-dihydropterin-6-yl-methyl-4-(beta-D-ribofuranosyl)aminobenzene 5'-phosphate synthase